MKTEERKVWNANHKILTGMILKPAEHERAVDLFLKQHALLYASRMANTPYPTLEDELMNDMSEDLLRKYPVVMKDTRNSIVWHLWHITRIEDITMNILVKGTDQIAHSGSWLDRLKVDVQHSGNEMEPQEIAEFSKAIDIDALLDYRIAVARRTREIVQSLEPGQFKQKVDAARIVHLYEQGALSEKAAWLADYWGSKTVAGLVLMPATRHPFVHLNKSLRIKHKYL